MKYRSLFLSNMHRGIRIVGILLAVILLGALVYSLPQPEEFALEISTVPLPELREHSHGLGEAEGDDGHGVYAASEVVVAPEDMWVTRMESYMVNAPQSTIHHFVLKELGVPDPSCPELNGKVIFLVGKDSQRHQPFPEPYALFIPKGTPLSLTAMIHNAEPPKGEGGTYENVSAVMKLHAVRNADTRLKPLAMRFLILSDTAYCSAASEANTFSVPAQTTGYVQIPRTLNGITRGELAFDADAHIVGIGGHTHADQGGTEIAVYLNDRILQLITPRATGQGLWQWQTWGVTRDIPVERGDTLSITATYDNPDVVPTRGAMGIVGVMYWEPSKRAELLAPYVSTGEPIHVPDTYGAF